MTESATAPTGNGATRKRLLIAIAAACAVAGVAYGVYWATVARYVEETDDAYVAGNVVQVTPQVAGTVTAIEADDTQLVKAGQPLVTLDRADARVALDQAEAQLAQAVREARTLYLNNDALQASVALRDTELARSRDDLQRREQAAQSGGVTEEELSHARAAVKAATASLVVAEEQLAANRALTAGTSVVKHPTVQRAAARVREAYLALARASVVAPVSGYVAKRAVQVGQRVAPGAPLMAVVPLDGVWIDANFKEGQLARMHPGQAVTVRADVYGSDAVYHGRVAGLAAGTGSAFALLPAQNATGNWIKVVQRLPVRIVLDPQELAKQPLRIGMSTVVRVDTQAADKPATMPAAALRTPVFDGVAREADALVERIIGENLGLRDPIENKPRVSGQARPSRV